MMSPDTFNPEIEPYIAAAGDDPEAAKKMRFLAEKKIAFADSQLPSIQMTEGPRVKDLIGDRLMEMSNMLELD